MLVAAVLVTVVVLVASCGSAAPRSPSSSPGSTGTPTTSPPVPSPTVSIDRAAPPGFVDLSDVAEGEEGVLHGGSVVGHVAMLPTGSLCASGEMM